MNRTSILLNRMHKLETLQCKISALMEGRVSGGALPAHIREGLKTDKVRNKLKAKIDKAEKLRLKIAIAIYEDI